MKLWVHVSRLLMLHLDSDQWKHFVFFFYFISSSNIIFCLCLVGSDAPYFCLFLYSVSSVGWWISHMGFIINFMSFGCKHFFRDFMFTSLHEANGKSLVIFQTVMPKYFRLSSDSYKRFILAHTTHSFMTRFLVLKNQPHDIQCVVIFYFHLFFIEVFSSLTS